jgi:hypothetical protein
MTVATAQAIQYLNLAYFGRPADPASLSAWPASGQSLEQIVLAFTATSEYATNTVAPNSVVNASGGRTFNDTNLINTFYQRLFGRLATAQEVAGWADALARGAVNYDYLGITILQAGLNLPADTEMRQVLVAKFDSNQLYTGILYNNPVDAAAYSTAAAIQDGIAFSSSNTTTTPATIAQAQTAVNQMVADSGAGGGQTFTLTTAIETVPATGTMPANSTVTGVIAAGASTFQTGDTINGNSTSDINVNVVNDVANLVTINTARAVNFRNLSNGAVVGTDQLLWNNVGTFASVGSGAGSITANNAALATTYSIVNPIVNTGASIDVTYRAGDITGATDVARFSVTGAGNSSDATNLVTSLLQINNNSTGATATGVESAQIATTGTNNLNINFGTNVTGVVVTGAGVNNMTTLANGINATTQNYNLSAATGANTLDVAATLATGATVTGGTGADVLRVTPAGRAITNLNVTGVETLRLRNAAANGTLGFTAAPAFETIRLDAGGNQGTIVTLLNGVASTQAVTYRGADTAATAAAQQVFNGITGTGALTGAADTLNISLSNNGRALTGANAYRTGVVNTAGIETVAVTIADAAAAGLTTLDGFTSNTLTSFTATGTGSANATLTGTNAATGGALSTINVSGLTGTGRSVLTVAANSLAAASTTTASAGGTGLILAAEAADDVLNFTGGAGVDIINDDGLVTGATSLFQGFVNFNGGAGADEIFLTNSAGVVANGGDDADIMVGSNVIDTLRGDAGDDQLTGQGGADVITGGTGADDFIMAGIVTGGVLGVDTITDFTLAQADQIGGYNATNLETLAILGNLETARGADNVGNDAVVTSAANVAAAVNFDALAAGTNMVLIQGNYANAAALQADIRANVTSDGAYAANDGFMVAYDNGVNTFVALVTTAAGVNDNALWADAVVTDITTLSNVADATTLTAAAGAWLAFTA